MAIKPILVITGVSAAGERLHFLEWEKNGSVSSAIALFFSMIVCITNQTIVME